MENQNVYQRIADVMADVGYLTKDDSVETGGGKSYRAITEEKVTSTIRASLIKNGLVILPISQERIRTDERVTAFDKYRKCDVEKINRVVSVDVRYRIQNVDDPQDYIEVASSGEGVDTQDKGVGKAMTYAYKYMLLRTFAIPTGDDPDKISSDLYTDKLLGTSEARQEASQERFKPNVYNAEDLIAKIYAIGEAKNCDKEKMDGWAVKNRKKPLAEMTVEELLSVIKFLDKKAG